jgi:hypothetical protein
LVVLALPLIYVISRHNYNLFHSLADGVSIVIASCTFLIIWTSRRSVDNHYFLYAGIAFLFFAILDLMHLLGNKGMGIFSEYGNLGPAFYIASRYLLSISLIIAPLFITRKLNTTLMFTAYTLATSLILLSILSWRIFPVCIVEGVGLTPFKVISDYIICLILLSAIGLLLVNRRAFDAGVLWKIVSSLVLAIATGLTFTLYTDPFGVTNLFGHAFQISSFYLVYLAFIETILIKPQEILFGKLQQNEETLTKNLQQLDRANVELKKTEEQLRLALARAEEGDRLLSALMEYAPEGITMIDAEFNVTRVSRYGQELLGHPQGNKITADGAVQKDIFDADGETPLAFADLPLVRAVRGGEIVKDTEIVQVNDRGVRLPLLCNAGPIRDGDGKVIGGIVAWRDISDHKRVEEALRRSNQELQQFAYAASHDLQEPLRAIIGFLQLLQDRYSDKVDEKGQSYIERTVKAGHRMQRMIKDLLNLSKVSNGETKFAPANLNQVVQDVLESLQTIVLEKKADIRCADLPTLEVDAAQMRSLFQNVILNGLRYNESPQPVIEIGSLVHDNLCRIFIRDNGIGIPPKFHQRIFMVFQRLHTDREYAGTGMGLALCKKIVERHGGTIWVESEGNEGATFYFTLPLSR